MTKIGGALIAVTSVVMSSLGHFSLKLGAVKIQWKRSLPFLSNLAAILSIPALWAGVALQGCALILWVYALSVLELGFAYPFLALGYVLIMILSIFFLGESWNLLRFLGMALIIGGVMLVARS